MKKAFSRILIGILIISLTGCGSSQKKDSTTKDAEENFDIKIAQNVVDVYMGYLMKEDQVSIAKLYSKELASKTKPSAINDLKVRGYNIGETNEIGHTGVFKLKVARSDVSKPAAALDEYTIKVKKEDNEYKIDDITSMADREAYNQSNQLRLRTKDNVKTNLIIDSDGIPEYVFSKDDKANVNKISAPRNNFGTINFSYGGAKLAISTYDKDSYIGIVKIDESMAVQGGGQDSKGGEQQKGGQQPQGASGIGAKEPPVGKEIVSVDLLKDSKVDFMIFSLDEKFLLAQYTTPLGGKNLRLYYSENGNLIPFRFDQNYPEDAYDVVFSSFDKGVLNYEVAQKANAKGAKNELLGKWQLDLEKFKQKKL